MVTGRSVFDDPKQTELDLSMIEKEYVRKVLFPRVKFVYDDKQLGVGEFLHTWFVKACLDDQMRLGGKTFANADEKKAYVNFLWDKIVDRKLYPKWLSNRRSTVYTIMQHKFKGVLRLVG